MLDMDCFINCAISVNISNVVIFSRHSCNIYNVGHSPCPITLASSLRYKAIGDAEICTFLVFTLHVQDN